MQQDREGVQKIIIAALEDVHHTDQAAAHVPPHLHLQISMDRELVHNIWNRPWLESNLGPRPGQTS